MKKWFTIKLVKLMKICALQVMLATLFCLMATAHSNYAQLLEREVTIKINNATLEQALHQIEEVAKIKFVYSTNNFNSTQVISIEVEAKSLKYLLHKLLDPLNISFKVHEAENSITLKKSKISDKSSPQSFLQSGADSYDSYTNKVVTGIVTDGATRQPMAGVNIVIKGTLSGTTTDANGSYSIQVNDDDILIFSFIGYQTVEERISSLSVINVVLQEDIQSLKEVVINAGYYTTTKATQTGSIKKITAREIAQQPIQNPIASLQGRVPGLEIIQQTGVPGGNFQVRIRGTNSLSSGNDPLYIINGVPFTSSTLGLPETSGGISGPGGFSPLNSIDPSTIESIEILKDADATAIYGSRGANGVILITTKKGEAGKTKVDFSFYSGAGKVAKQLTLLNSKEYVAMRKQAFINDNVAPTMANARDLLVWDTTRYTNWQKVLLGGTANLVDAQVSVSGGNAQTQFRLGSGYHSETTVFPGSNKDERISLLAHINNASANQKFNTSVSINYSVNLTNLLRQDLTGRALSLPPVAPPLYTASGELNWINWSSSYENPLAYTKRQFEGTTYNLLGNAVLSYTILPSLSLVSNLGYTNLSSRAITLSPVSAQYPDPSAQNSTAFSTSSFQNWIVEPQLRYNPVFNESQFDVLIGSTFLDQTSEGFAQSGFGFTSEALMRNISSAPIRTIGTNNFSQYRYHAFFGRINYKLHDKYIINLTARRDGSSRFGPGKQFAIFGAMGAAWLFSQETFIKNKLQVLSFGKLRMSYGTTGNDQIGDYQYLDTYINSPGAYLNVIGLQPNRLSNPVFGWEVNKKYEAGLELGFIKNRIMTDINLYYNRSSSQLVGFPLPQQLDLHLFKVTSPRPYKIMV
jgi:TonB-dependent starch-binding outer membrane protein SusC